MAQGKMLHDSLLKGLSKSVPKSSAFDTIRYERPVTSPQQ